MRGVRQPQRASLLRRLDAFGLQPLEPCLVLVHLRELALAAVALDQLPLARDLPGLDGRVLRGALVALDALAVEGAVVAPERGQAPIAQLPDPLDRSVEECAVVGGDEQGAGPPAEVLLEPLERADVEVVRRLVEEQQVGVRDDEPGERGARLLATGQRRGRTADLVAA